MYIGLPGILTIIFVIAKIMDKIDWSWFWVLSPIWIPPVLGIVFIIGMLLLQVTIILWPKS